jgi:hypothetical protein
MAVIKKRAIATINKPADEIWARIGNFADIKWIPGSEAAHAKVDGNIRTVTRDAWKNFSLVQRLTEHDDKRHTYSYDLPDPLKFEMLGPGKVVNVLNGTLAVTPTGPSQSTVTWDIETEDFLIGGTHAEYQKALDTLKAKMDG